jgi:hypothetical protein
MPFLVVIGGGARGASPKDSKSDVSARVESTIPNAYESQYVTPRPTQG